MRRERDLTQQEMADAIGVHVNQVRRYEAGATQPSLDALKKIAVADVLDYFSAKARSKGVELNTMINDLLKKDIALIEGVK